MIRTTKICKDYALPSNPDNDTAAQARIYSTLTFYNTKYSDCYCKDPEKTGTVFADCQVLKGGNLDKTYYISLTHECTVKKAMAGIGVLARFDPSVSKEAWTIALLALWDLIRMLAKLENMYRFGIYCSILSRQNLLCTYLYDYSTLYNPQKGSSQRHS